jgi:membrane peptidoglycan carboxypeptidase
MMVREELGQLLGEETVRRGGLRVVTTLDLDLQRAAEGQVQRHLADLNAPPRSQPSHEVRNAAVVVLDPRSGAVRALVGSPDYFDAPSAGAVNGALALRQPGSAIKPLTYAAALARGFSPATMLADERTVFTTAEGVSYVPVNYDFRHHGLVSLRQALACSYNVVAVKVLDQIGLEALLQIARQTGLTSFDAGRRFGLALTLGGGEVQLLQLSAAYAALANGGWRVAPHVIERVEDAQGRVLYRTSSLPLEQVLDERVAYLITDILADPVARVPTFGEGSALELPFPAAVKTGTTNAWRDNWTVGYSTDWVTGVWVGNADGAPMVNVSGVSGAAPIWNGVMRFSHRLPPAPFPRPLGVVEAEVCAESGLLPGEACPRRKRELLLAENVPTAHCPLHATPAGEENEGVVGATHASPLQLGSMASSPLPVIISPDPHSVYVLSAALPVEMQQIEVAVACPEGSAACVGPLSVWVDERLWHTWAAPPYTALWPLAVGEHTIQARGAGADSEVVRVRVQAGE